MRPVNIYTAQVAVSGTTSGQVLIAARPSRLTLTIKNTDTSITIYYSGSPSVSTSTGFEVKAGQSKEVRYPGILYAIAASGVASVHVEDEYGYS